MRNKIGKVCAALVFACFVSVSPVFAYGVYKADRNDRVGDRMTFAGFNWRVYKTDNMYSYITVTDYLDKIPFRNDKDDSSDPDYPNSDFRKMVNNYETQMKNYNGPQLTWKKADGGPNCNYIVKHDMKDVFKEDYDDMLFIMSLQEARAMGTSKLARDVLSLGDMWYLRTPGLSKNGNVCVVIKHGYISDFGTKAYIRQYVRPCLQVNRRSDLYKPVYLFKSALGAKEKLGIGDGFMIEDFDPSKDFKRTKATGDIESPVNVTVRQRNGNSTGSCAKNYCIIEPPSEIVRSSGTYDVNGETLEYRTQPPKISYTCNAVRQGKADFVSVIAENKNNGRYVSYAKVSALAEVADGKGISVPFGKLPDGSYKLWIFADKLKDGEDECSQFVGSCVIENGAHGEKGYAVLGTDNVNKKFTIAPSDITLLFKNRVSYAQDFEVSKPGVIFTGLYEEGAGVAGADTAGGKIGGKLTVRGQTLKVNQMTLTSLLLENNAVIDVCSDSILNQPGPHKGADDAVSGTLTLEPSDDFIIKEGSRIIVEHNCRVINRRGVPVTVWDNANQMSVTIPSGKTLLVIKNDPREPYYNTSQLTAWKTDVSDDEPVIPLIASSHVEVSYKNEIVVQNSPNIAAVGQLPYSIETEISKAAEYVINMIAAWVEYALYEDPESIIGVKNITEITEKTGFNLKITHAEGTGENETLKIGVKLDVPIESVNGKKLAVILPMKSNCGSLFSKTLCESDEETDEFQYGVFKADYNEETQIITFEIPEYGEYFACGDEVSPVLVTVVELNGDAKFDGEGQKKSSGCNAGLSALALLGILGLFYEKKK